MRLHSNHLRQEGLPHPRPGFHHLRRRHRAGRGVWKATLLEAWKRDWSHAEKKVVIGDGAEWIWNLAEPYFPGAVQIVDLFQVVSQWHRQSECLDQGSPATTPRQGKIEKLVVALRSTVSTNLEAVE